MSVKSSMSLEDLNFIVYLLSDVPFAAVKKNTDKFD